MITQALLRFTKEFRLAISEGESPVDAAEIAFLAVRDILKDNPQWPDILDVLTDFRVVLMNFPSTCPVCGTTFV